MKEALHMVQISSQPNNIALVEALVQKITTGKNLSQDLHGNILVSLTEAVNNAIIHGNCCDKNKNVKIEYTERRNLIKFKVSDEGKGFNPDSIPDPTAPENIYNIGGRGVFLMRQLCDQIVFKDKGRTVEMHFNI
ncbi:MAG TPA: ATP-binding protein [Saprospiraceae bacterium]|nr:ATP-binding protein [Saprospiraceae bacterium]HMW74303.1 ATP-binding protein [Saprospiraceae bacterium]HMX82855.1 ATP-binding protein [Saprospiraceae bacterium]HMX84433.1 ATP-binding protein [Saprospiraceae bacterium]HNA40676.1 ATP-binding protein [Saprospiraceae bacterium]